MKVVARSMRQLDLTEYERSAPYKLSSDERKALRGAELSLTIEDAEYGDGLYTLRGCVRSSN